VGAKLQQNLLGWESPGESLNMLKPMESQWAHMKITGIYIGIAMYSPIVGLKKPLK
jgi:hypothetical protein